MSIESSSTASSLKMLTPAESHGAKGKGKVKPGEEPENPAAAGFLALMTALDAGADVSVDMADPQAELGFQTSTPAVPQVATGPSADPVDASLPSWPNDLALLLAQAGAGGAAVLDPTAGVANQPVTATALPADLQLSSAAANVLAQTLSVNQVIPQATVVGTIAVGVSNPASHGQALATTAGVRASSAATGQGKEELSLAAAAPLLNLTPADASQAIDAMLAQAAQTLPALSSKGTSAGSLSGVGATVADARALQQAIRADLGATEPTLSGALVSSGVGDVFLRPAERSASKFSSLPAGAGMEGSWGHQALLAGSRANASPALADPALQSLESMVADTVSYWVTQGVQNAELKLDGFGGEPVEVRISLKGDQAHIGFRTDQPEIRQMLEGALGNLKELLKGEGLVLSGVSVGTSGQEGAGAQEQRNQAGARQASLTTTDKQPAPIQQRLIASVGRGLDIFV